MTVYYQQTSDIKNKNTDSKESKDIDVTRGHQQMSIKRARETNVGYHATRPEYAKSIQINGFRESVSGRAGGGGVYVNNTPEGAIAEYRKYNPNGPEPVIFKVEYNAGTNVIIENPGSHITGPLPINGDTLTFESTQMPETYNTIVRNGSINITDKLK